MVRNGSEAVFTDQAESKRAVRRPEADPFRVAWGWEADTSMAH
jgi:hypothetical protein